MAESRELLHGSTASMETSNADMDDQEEELLRETEDVIFRELQKRGPDEPKRTCLLFMSLYEVHHAQSRVLQLPGDTLYTAAIVMPMIARSSGYTKTMTAIAVKVVLLTFVCIALQSGLIVSFWHARTHLPGLDGVPSLCTYGQDVGANRRPFGPTGQKYERNYGNVETDYTMLMVRNTLAEVMKKMGVQNDAIGPVEYGMESTTCRFVCIVVFCVGICGEVFSMDTLLRFIIYSPTLRRWSRESTSPNSEANVDRDDGVWVCFDEGSSGNDAKEIWPIIGKSSLDHIKFKCSGMPMLWKAFSSCLLLCRIGVNFFTFWNGLSFLMNTGSIVELILNSLALMFIVELDRVMFSTLTRGITKDIIRRLEPLQVRARPGELQAELNRRKKSELEWGPGALILRFVKQNKWTIIVAAVTMGGHYVYFLRHCNVKVAPFDFSGWGSESYFLGQTRYFGGWEFLLGNWYSKNTTDVYTHTVTCDPAWHSLEADEKRPPVGCGVPKPWTTAGR